MYIWNKTLLQPIIPITCQIHTLYSLTPWLPPHTHTLPFSHTFSHPLSSSHLSALSSHPPLTLSPFQMEQFLYYLKCSQSTFSLPLLPCLMTYSLVQIHTYMYSVSITSLCVCVSFLTEITGNIPAEKHPNLLTLTKAAHLQGAHQI